jgi:hypothetical protein
VPQPELPSSPDDRYLLPFAVSDMSFLCLQCLSFPSLLTHFFLSFKSQLPRDTEGRQPLFLCVHLQGSKYSITPKLLLCWVAHRGSLLQNKWSVLCAQC